MDTNIIISVLADLKRSYCHVFIISSPWGLLTICHMQIALMMLKEIRSHYFFNQKCVHYLIS